MISKRATTEWPIPKEHWVELARPNIDPELPAKSILLAVGIILTPITLLGSVLGYRRAYGRFMEPWRVPPFLVGMPSIVKAAMVLGALLIWVGLGLLLWLLAVLIQSGILEPETLGIYFVINLVGVIVVYVSFQRWRNIKGSEIIQFLDQADKFGTARWADPAELHDYVNSKGIYTGGNYSFAGKGHILTCAGTRGGKGVNLIIPNLLGIRDYSGSWVVIDPKGENAAITANYQFGSGRDTIVLNPWDLFHTRLGKSDTYNPLDILADKTSPHLVDDAQIIAEMLVPIDKGERDRFFTDNARAIVAGLILHLMTVPDKEAEDDGAENSEEYYQEPEEQEVAEENAAGKEEEPNAEEEEQAPPQSLERTLKTLWKWVRLPQEPWLDLIADMAVSEDEVNGEVIRNSANEILKLASAGEKTFGSIMATILQCTDFLKSPSLQASLVSGFDPRTLADGNKTLYVIIPADKLQSHGRWLRLVVTSAMRAVVRKPNKRVTFLLDEFAALGYLPEIETALSTYAGFEITVWPIIQSLIQLKGLYGDNWETFIGNTTVRQFFTISDNFTADYVSKAMGQATNVIVKRDLMGKVKNIQSNARQMITHDELRRGSGQNIFAFFGDKPPIFYIKKPYYEMQEIAERAEKNPYND